ncbi:hypothetical protein [Kineococcus rhizosphaerae]|uniref:Uncharacterized protein n=1 Tax=Kineococcus rhizosphaerae TaxID=559628 RepID=A0A2T0R6X5_9ACTN|nr:hypothetical protein [Kineococcus rhizosphaerae]PRY16926.1 hypothetical protein CLV37_103360 [Kineococcus rhizosphaerae]
MSDEAAVDHAEDERRRRVDRRSTIDLTRVERGEPERRRLPGVDRRDNDDSADAER